MVRIQNETTYKAAMERIEELLPLTDDNVPLTVSTQFRASPFERALFSALNRVSLKN